MQGGGLVAELVVQIDNHSVTNGSLDAWYGPLSIDSNDRPVEKAIRVSGDPTHIEVIDTDFAVNQRN
jgi:hypothetical protein